MKTTLAAVNAALEPYWKRIVVLGVESTFNWHWFVDGLREQGRNVKRETLLDAITGPPPGTGKGSGKTTGLIGVRRRPNSID